MTEEKRAKIEKALQDNGIKEYLLIGLDEIKNGHGEIVFGSAVGNKKYTQDVLHGIAGTIIEIANQTEEVSGIPAIYTTRELVKDIAEIVIENTPIDKIMQYKGMDKSSGRDVLQ